MLECKLLAVTVRTIATNDLTENNFTSNVIKEFSIGILNGIIFAVISAFIVQIWFQDSTLSIIISISMVLTMIIAGLFGILGSSYFKKNEYRSSYCIQRICHNNY
jgi:magnesium transporter